MSLIRCTDDNLCWSLCPVGGGFRVIPIEQTVPSATLVSSLIVQEEVYKLFPGCVLDESYLGRQS